MKRSVKTILSITLSLLILFSCCAVGFAATEKNVRQYGKEGGYLAIGDSISRGCGAAANLGATVDEKHRYTLPDGSEREIVIFKKNAPTPGRYPRNAAQIDKKPL